MSPFRAVPLVLGLVVAAGPIGCAGASNADGAEGAAGVSTDALSFSSQQVTAAGFAYPFENWDHDPSNEGKVDNPVSIIFVSSSPNLVARMYDQVESEGLTHSGSKMALSGIGGSRPGVRATDPWTSESAGRKGAFGCWGQCSAKTDIHIRTYGPNGREGTQIYQSTYGIAPYYLIASTHFDIDENTPQADFGYQDTARAFLVDKMVAAAKWRVVGSVPVENECAGRTDGSHMCEHDGTATVVTID